MIISKEFKRNETGVLAQVDNNGILIFSNGGWSVPIHKSHAKDYIDAYAQEDNSKNKSDWGFFDVESKVVLTHNHSKISFSREEFHAIRGLILTADKELWQ